MKLKYIHNNLNINYNIMITNMDKFYEEITLLSSQNIEIKIELERQKENDHKEKIKRCIDNVYHQIINSIMLKEKITDLASKGYNKCVLYEFDLLDTEEETGLPLIFIFKGPKFDNGEGRGLRFFKNIETYSLIYKLNKYFSPFKIYFHFNGKNKKYTLDIIW